MRECDYYKTSSALFNAWEKECNKHFKIGCPRCKYRSDSLNDTCWAIFALSEHVNNKTEAGT